MCAVKIFSSVFCEIRCFSFNTKKNKLDPAVYIVPSNNSNNESEIPAKKRPGLGKRSFLFTAQKMKLSITEFFRKYDQIWRKLRIWSHLLKKSLMENFILWAVVVQMNINGFM